MIIEVWVNGTPHSVDTDSQDALNYFTWAQLNELYPNWSVFWDWLRGTAAYDKLKSYTNAPLVAAEFIDSIRQQDHARFVSILATIDAAVSFTQGQKDAANTKANECWLAPVFP